MKLIEQTNLGYVKESTTTNVQYPLDDIGYAVGEERLDLSTGSPSLYTSCVPLSEQRPLNFVVGIEKAIARILIHSTGKEITNFGGWGFDAKGNFYADYYGGSVREFNSIYLGNKDFSKERRQIFRIDANTKKLTAFCIDGDGNRSKLYLVSNKDRTIKSKHHSSGVIYALLTYLISMMESKRFDTSSPEYAVASVLYEHYRDCVVHLVNGEKLEFASADRKLDGDIYTILAKSNNVLNTYGFNCLNLTLYDRDEFDLLTESEFRLAEVHGNSELLTGAKKIRNSGGFTESKHKETVKKYLGEFVLDPSRILSPNELNMVPNLDSYSINDEILVKTKLIKESSKLPLKMRNILFTGEAGSGKSTAAKIIAQLLNLPYTFYTFNTDTMLSDLYMNIIPNCDTLNREKFIEASKDMLDCTSISFDPAGQYEHITGTKKEDATEADCISAMLEKQYDMLSRTSDFRYVESPLVQAFRYGWVCELQEVNVCSKSGVLSGINAALDDLSSIVLPTGEVVKRHPDCVVIMTMNDGYEGTRPINQAVRSRCTLKGNFVLPDDEELADIIMLQSGNDDKKEVLDMITVMKEIRQKLRNSGVDVACGVREVTGWAAQSQILDHDAHQAAEHSILYVTTDEDICNDLRISVETKFDRDYASRRKLQS